ncbi:kinase-like domain-containing protein [Mycena latifolia]|nr:kinase-like domain-containing protein [Mycena latifolia]
MPARFYYPEAPLPSHLEHWERLDMENYTAHLIDEPWRHFEPYLASCGYTLCWRYYSRDRPETPVRKRSFDYPVAQDPFRPNSGEGFVHHLQDENTEQEAGGIHQTTGWLTQCSSLKMAYDSQDRVCALKALHNWRARAEIDIITFLNSPKLRSCADNHTIPILDTIVTDDWTFIVMPYWPRSVQTCIPWEVDDYFNRLTQALEGLCSMHRHGIIHRDISVGNMLLNVHSGVPGVYSSFGRRNIALGYIDFGCAVRFPAGSDPASWVGTGHWGTMDHTAPEVPRRHDRRDEQPHHLPQVDIYAFGSVFARALSWEQIYCTTFGNPEGRPTAAHQVLQALVPEYRALLQRMQDFDPARRPTAAAALEQCRALRAALPPAIRFAPADGYSQLDFLREHSAY